MTAHRSRRALPSRDVHGRPTANGVARADDGEVDEVPSQGGTMKRTIGALLAAALVGCQSAGLSSNGHAIASRSQQLTDAQKAKDSRQKQLASSRAPTTSRSAKYDPEVVQTGYNQGWGAMQNNSFHQRVGRAVPSHGGAVPGMPGPEAGPPPGYGGAGPGYCPPGAGPGGPGAGALAMGGLGPRFTTGRTQVRFQQPTGMNIGWQSFDGSADGGFTEPQLQVPARFNFVQARIYRLKLTNIVNRPGVELYPTLEVYPGNFKVDSYLAHNAVPIEFSEEDFDQVVAGNYVTKVIYLPDPKYQDLAIAGVETLVSTRLDPGVDPVQEAHRRGSILAVVRIGSVDLEMPHSPALFQGAPVPPVPVPAPGAIPLPSTTPIPTAAPLAP